MALAPNNDPFYFQPNRIAAAQWFADLFARTGLTSAHYRRVHYVLVSTQPKMPDGKLYENTKECWAMLCTAARDAIATGFVPADAFVDNRNDEPIIHLVQPTEAEIVSAGDSLLLNMPGMPELPYLALREPTIPQPYHIEIWCEKTTVNDVLEPLSRRYELNLITGSGELSATACRNVVKRAERSQRPVRILYVSDFDPAGRSMPVAVARKVEHTLYERGSVDLDIQVRPIVLTPEQCREYSLPRIPIKETEKRAPDFEERFGKGATELDALEALRPGELRRIVEKEIRRYWDPDHDDRLDARYKEFRERLAVITADAIAPHQGEIDDLEAKFRILQAEFSKWRIAAEPVWQPIGESLEEHKPDIDDIDLSTDFRADEDLDPLFDSGRDYVTQVDRYKHHQEKATSRKPSAKRGWP